jgi:hypothetical protein
MKPTPEQLRAALLHELHRLQAHARLAVSSAGHLNGLALNPDTKRPDLVPESSVVREVAALLEHATQNLARQVATAPPRKAAVDPAPNAPRDNAGRTHEARSAQFAPAHVPSVCLQC